MNKKKIIIVSMKAGFGHLKAGQALFDYAEKFLPNIQVAHVDIATIDRSFKKYAKVYDFISKKIPLLWGFCYLFFNIPFFASILKKLHLANYFLSDTLRQYLKKEQPHILLFTNMAPLPLFSLAFKREFPDIKIGVVVTDYHGHAYYSFPFVDYYFTSSKSVSQDLVRAGVDSKKIIESGIPISPDFLEPQDSKALREMYAIYNDLPVVLLIASFRIEQKKLLQLISDLLQATPAINVIVLTNNNEERYKIIEKKFPANGRLILVNWTDKMSEYMKLANVVITKSGGLTVSECLALRKPMIIINPILGQEEHNALFVEKNGMGKWARHIEDVPTILAEMLAHPPELKNDLLIQNASEKIFKTLIKN